MTTIYFTGQNNFGNRGCEALVRSTVATLREQDPSLQFLVPSLDIARDSAQWPEAAQSGVRFVPSPSVPASYKWWGRLCKFLPMMKSLPWPSLKGLSHLEEYLQEADAVISIGGDNYSLDYGLVSLFFFVGIAERAMELGKKTALWGASVGPFSQDPQTEKQLAKHLNRVSFISIRESHSVNYLKNIGVAKNVTPVVDSAFALEKISVDIEKFWPTEFPNSVVGINVSPLVADVYARNSNGLSLENEVIDFINQISNKTNHSILLIPHVAPLNGDKFNNDEIYLAKIFEKVKSPRVSIAPFGLNACEIKTVISKCRYFIGARTHATIGAISSNVPTISIAYSVKARGINFDIFSNEKYVLPTPEIKASTLWNSLQTLINDEDIIKTTLEEKMPQWKNLAHKSANVFHKNHLKKC